MLTRVGPNGEPKTTPSICFYKNSVKKRYDSLLARDNNSLNSDFFKPSTPSFWLYIHYVQILVVSSSGMLIKSESTFNLPIQKLLSCSTISPAYEKVFVNSLVTQCEY